MAEAALVALFVLRFLLGEDGFVVGLSGGQQVIDDTRQFMRGGGNGFGSAEFGSHTAVVLAESAVAARQRLGGHAQRPGHAIVHLAGARVKYLPAADAIIRTESHP